MTVLNAAFSDQPGGFRLFVVSGRPRPCGVFLPSLVRPGPNTTRALGGRLRIAVVQSVGAGWRVAGTLSTQIRHMPGGGMYSFGIDDSRSFFCGGRSFDFGGASDCAPAGVARMQEKAISRRDRFMANGYPTPNTRCLSSLTLGLRSVTK